MLKHKTRLKKILIFYKYKNKTNIYTRLLFSNVILRLKKHSLELLVWP